MSKILKFFSLTILITLALSPLPMARAEVSPIVFLIDTSGSMKGPKIEAVKSAVKNIIDNLKTDQPIAIINFDNQASIILNPTTDRLKAVISVETLAPSGNTSLYDAIRKSQAQGKSWGAKQLVLLSDGEDTSSQNKLKEVLNALQINPLTINSIGINVSNEQQGTLTQISELSGGKFYNVEDISLLIATYKEILQEVLRPSPTSAPINSQSNSLNSVEKYLPQLLGAITSILVFSFLMFVRKQSRKRLEQRERFATLQKYSLKTFNRSAGKFTSSIKSFGFVPIRIEKWIRNQLELVHSDFKYETVIKGIIFGWVFLFLLLNFVFKSFFLSLVLAILIGPFILRSIFRSIHRKQQQEFANELPELLNILASALRSGLSLAQGLEAYTADSRTEVARQIRRVTGETRVGTPIEDALGGVAERMNSDDLKWAVTALSIQRVVGGSLATILSTTYETVRSRAEIRREVKTLAAEGKLSAYVLMALPIGIFSFLFLTRREYIRLFYTTPVGFFLLGVIAVSMVLGWIWIKKVVEIKI